MEKLTNTMAHRGLVILGTVGAFAAIGYFAMRSKDESRNLPGAGLALGAIFGMAIAQPLLPVIVNIPKKKE